MMDAWGRQGITEPLPAKQYLSRHLDKRGNGIGATGRCCKKDRIGANIGRGGSVRVVQRIRSPGFQ